MDLHPLERKVLEGLQVLNGRGTAEAVAEAGGIERIQAERFGFSLSQKKLVKQSKVVAERVIFTELGQDYAKNGLPEQKVLAALKSGALVLEKAVEKSGIAMNEFSAVLGILKRNAWVNTRKTDAGLELELNSLGKDVLSKGLPAQAALDVVSAGKTADETQIQELTRRNIVKIESVTTYSLELLKGADAALKGSENIAQNLTHEDLKTNAWRDKKFRSYDVQAPAPKVHGGTLHPLTVARNKIRRVFLEMGFQEAEGPFVESSFWNFDALFQPQDHPARDLADTFYLSNPTHAKLPADKTVNAVKRAHEEGVKNSTGWQYNWTRENAQKAILRTHTTSVSARMLSQIKPPAKIFSVGRTFRNETVDYKHLPEFTQVEGIVADENVSFKDLLGYLKEFFWKMGFEKIRFRPAYFPYTEMSVEPEVYFEEKDEWIELGGSGIFRSEVTEPLGINVPVLAWGLSLERPVMLRLGWNDIRDFYYKNDLKKLREVPVV